MISVSMLKKNIKDKPESEKWQKKVIKKFGITAYQL